MTCIPGGGSASKSLGRSKFMSLSPNLNAHIIRPTLPFFEISLLGSSSPFCWEQIDWVRFQNSERKIFRKIMIFDLLLCNSCIHSSWMWSKCISLLFFYSFLILETIFRRYQRDSLILSAKNLMKSTTQLNRLLLALCPSKTAPLCKKKCFISKRNRILYAYDSLKRFS